MPLVNGLTSAIQYSAFNPGFDRSPFEGVYPKILHFATSEAFANSRLPQISNKSPQKSPRISSKTYPSSKTRSVANRKIRPTGGKSSQLLARNTCIPSPPLPRIIDSESAVINPDLSLTARGITYTYGKKGNPNLPQVNRPNLKLADHGIDYRVNSTFGMPGDGTGSDKSMHNLILTDDCNAPRFAGDPNFQGNYFVGFSMKLMPDFNNVQNPSLLFFQFWQGGEQHPPLSFELQPYAPDVNVQRMRIRTINKTGLGSTPACQSREQFLLQDYPLQLGQWYRFVVQARPSYLGSSQTGLLKVWVNDTPILSWKGYWGYIPRPMNGCPSDASGMTISLGIYRAYNQNRQQNIVFENIKYATQRHQVAR
ncbi:MAG TPA: heparin lyase I family protein [Stenomitos sp.]